MKITVRARVSIHEDSTVVRYSSTAHGLQVAVLDLVCTGPEEAGVALVTVLQERGDNLTEKSLVLVSARNSDYHFTTTVEK